MEIHVLGAGRDVGRSCLLLSAHGRHLLLDCGAHHGFSDTRRFPSLSTLPQQTLHNLHAVLITHYHFDHAAALPLLRPTLQRSTAALPPVYMTSPTKALTALLLADFHATSTTRAQYCPFTPSDIEAVLSNVTLIPLNTPTAIPPHPDIIVTAYPAGHTLGAVMFHIAIAGTTILYSGDYSIHSDRYIIPARIPPSLNPDLFITEATNCNPPSSPNVHPPSPSSFNKHAAPPHHPTLSPDEIKLLSAIATALSPPNPAKVLFAVPAFGRIPAICSLLTTHLPSPLLPPSTPIHAAAGLATQANATYVHQATTTTTLPQSAPNCPHCAATTRPPGASARKRRRAFTSRFANVCRHDVFSRLQPFHRDTHWHSLIEQPGPLILFATPATLSTGLSRDVFHAWRHNPHNVIIVPSASLTTSIAANPLHPQSPTQCPTRCKLVNLPSHLHATSSDIVTMCRHVAPRSIILVHGHQTKIIPFRKHLQNLLNVPCYAPANGDTLRINPTTLPRPPPQASLRQKINHELRDASPRLRTLIQQYRRCMRSLQHANDNQAPSNTPQSLSNHRTNNINQPKTIDSVLVPPPLPPDHEP